MSGGGAGLMSCVREGSLEPPYRPPHADPHHHGEGRTGRFLRGLRRMFKRRGSAGRTDASPDPKSSSTSELLDTDRHVRRKEGAYGSGLSVSHDSVFTGERSDDSSDEPRHAAPHHAALHHATHLAPHRAELVAAVRRRGRGETSDDDEDLGLPRSPPASPPTDKAKRHHAGISQSSCSDGSLLSVGSSEMDEDSSSGHHHSHDHSARSDLFSDVYSSGEPPMGLAPLSHSAARHKMAVRPRRTHPAPRRHYHNNPKTASALPITPELNEEMIRSTTPDTVYKSSEVVTESFSSSITTKHHIIKEQKHLLNKELQRVLETPSDTKMKSSSLPPGLALSQVVGQTQKLTIPEENTPRSSIKRSKSSSQGQSLRDGSPRSRSSTDDSHIQSYHSEERMSKYCVNKYADESCLEKKSKSDKKIDSDTLRSSKKEESFFSRWLLRKSGKKKKDQVDGECHEVKKSGTEKSLTQINKPSDTEKLNLPVTEHNLGPKPVPAERTHKSAGQKVFANIMHKRLDNKGAYMRDSESNYTNSFGLTTSQESTKVSETEKNTRDLKKSEDFDKALTSEIKTRFSRREEFNEKVVKRTSYKEVVEPTKRDSFSLHQDKSKRPTSVQRLVDPFSSTAFISNEVESLNKEGSLSPSLVISDDDPSVGAISIKKTRNESVFHSGSMPKNIPYFNPNIIVPESSSSKITKPKDYDGIKHMSRSSEFADLRSINKAEKSCTVTETHEVSSGFRSLGDDHVETRSSIGKSQSFRYASETNSISSQETQLPSLPAIVGISEPLLESWEVNYRKHISDGHDYSKRVSARNYDVVPGSVEVNYDSLPSSESSYLDSLKADINDPKKSFANSIHIRLDTNKRDSDISQIEAKIDDIISSPKPIMAPIPKSNSLDSIKSSPEKVVEDRRKTIAVESNVIKDKKENNRSSELFLKHETDNFVSVTHINKEPTLISQSDVSITSKTEHKSLKKSGVPEFLFLQLNKVDPKPTTNVVLTANVARKKNDSPEADKEQNVAIFEISETKSVYNNQIKQESTVTNKTIENVIDNVQNDENSPILFRKSVVTPVLPRSPSTPKAYYKRKSTSVELQDRQGKPRANSLSTEGSTEKIHDNISMDQKSYSSFGSKSSIQSTDSNEIRTPDRLEETVIYRKKPILLSKEIRGEKKNDDEPELMKVFARRSLKLKDSEIESLGQEIAESKNVKNEVSDNVTATRTKILKNEFNASIKSRDSDKENEDVPHKEPIVENRPAIIAARVSQFGVPHYQRSVSINSVSNPKKESAPASRNEVNKYKKEVSDSTPEKRLRNRTFPDLSNDREEIARNEAISCRDSLSKRSWLTRDDVKLRNSVDKEKRDSAVIEKDGDIEKCEEVTEKGADGEVDESLQFKCIFERRAEWEKRAQQGMTK